MKTQFGENIHTSASTSDALFNYSLPSSRRPQIDNSDHTANELFLEPVEVHVADARLLKQSPLLDIQGFECISHQADVNDLGRSPEADDRYRGEMASLMLELTGADEVKISPRIIIRRQLPPAPGEVKHAPTANFVHSDYSVAGAEQAQNVLYEPVPRDEIRRVAMFNMWRLLSPGPTDRPLALCDARSVEQKDIIAGDSHFPALKKQFETALIQFNPQHKWFYYPKLNSAELLVFKQSDTDTDRPRVVPHTAFEDRSCRAAALRISVESRCMAVWYA